MNRTKATQDSSKTEQDNSTPQIKSISLRRQKSEGKSSTSHVKAKSMTEWNDLIGRRISEAIEQGEFDELPGQGQPLNLRRNEYVPEDQQLAFNILEDNDLVPVWISERKAVLSSIAQLRSKISQQAEWHRSELQKSANDKERARISRSWQNWLGKWQTEIVELNKRIGTLNLQQPVAHLEVLRLQLDEELARVSAGEKL